MKTTAKRHARLRIAIIAMALHVGSPHPVCASETAVSCGLGLPPGAPGFAEAQARRDLEVKENGYLKVCDADLERYRIAFRPLAPIIATLPFKPVDLSGTEFVHFKALGAMVEPDDRSRSRLYRGFRTPEGHEVVLFEQDMSVDGANMGRNPEDEPERINGLPARLGVFQAPSGKAVSHLSWVEKRRAYELWIDTNVVGTPLRARLFGLASSLPPAIPACPNEIPPKPVRMDANGLPVDDPMPMTLAPAEIAARFDSSKRPCE